MTELQNPYLDRYRLFLQDPKVRTGLGSNRSPSREDLNGRIASIINPKAGVSVNEHSFSPLLNFQHQYPRELSKREMDHNNFRDVNKSFDGVKITATDSYRARYERENSRESPCINRSGSKSAMHSQLEDRSNVYDDSSVLNRLKRELDDERRKCAVLSKENELLINENKNTVERHSRTSKDSSAGIQKQFENILARLGDLENVNLRLKEKEKATMLECHRLEDKVRAAEEAKKLAEEKEIALIRENGRLRERIEGIEVENRRIRDELARVQRGSISMETRTNNETKVNKNVVDKGYEERRRFMDENEKLLNLVNELRREKTALEMKIKQQEEDNDEGRGRLVTFGQSGNILPPQDQDETFRSQEQDKRSQRTKRLLNSAAPSSMERSGSNVPEKTEKLEILIPQKHLSVASTVDSSPKLRGQIFQTTESKNLEDFTITNVKPENKHNRNYSMTNLPVKEPLMDKPAPIAVVRLSEQRGPIYLNNQLKNNMGLGSGKNAQSESVLNPFIDVSRLIARNRPNEDPSLVNVRTFDLKERR